MLLDHRTAILSHTDPVSAGGHGVLPGSPEGRAWTAALDLDRAAHWGPPTARCGAAPALEVWGAAHLHGCKRICK